MIANHENATIITFLLPKDAVLAFGSPNFRKLYSALKYTAIKPLKSKFLLEGAMRNVWMHKYFYTE